MPLLLMLEDLGSVSPQLPRCEAATFPLGILFGSFDLFVEIAILPAIESGALARHDMIDIVAALRRWETDGTWQRA
jgi:hypothetical protein